MSKHDNVIGYIEYLDCNGCARLFYYRKGDEADWRITKIFYGRHIRRLPM